MKRAIILGAILTACDSGSGDGTGGAGNNDTTASIGVTHVTSTSTQTTGATMGAQQPFSAGARLKVRTLTSDDGAKEQRGFYDTEIDVACSFARATDGTERCMPIGVPTAGAYFSDSECTVLVATSECPSIPDFVRVAVDSCPAATTVRSATGGSPGAVYAKPLGVCTQVVLGSHFAFNLGPEIPVSTWARAMESVE